MKQGKRGYKLLIKLSRNSIKQHNLAIRHKLRQMRGPPQEAVIKDLNPIIKGWSQYNTSVVSSKIFKLVDSVMFKRLWRWANRRHPNKGKYWIKRKYFRKYGNDNWRFMTGNGTHLIKHEDHVIKRHVKVKGTKSPYDGDWLYWGKRLSKIPNKSPRVIKLLKLQQSQCDDCRLWFKKMIL